MNVFNILTPKWHEDRARERQLQRTIQGFRTTIRDSIKRYGLNPNGEGVQYLKGNVTDLARRGHGQKYMDRLSPEYGVRRPGGILHVANSLPFQVHTWLDLLRYHLDDEPRNMASLVLIDLEGAHIFSGDKIKKEIAVVDDATTDPENKNSLQLTAKVISYFTGSSYHWMQLVDNEAVVVCRRDGGWDKTPRLYNTVKGMI